MRESWYWLDKEIAMKKPLGARVIRVTAADYGKCRAWHLFAEEMKDKDLWHNVGRWLLGNLNSVPL